LRLETQLEDVVVLSPCRTTNWRLRIANWKLEFNQSERNGLKLKLSNRSNSNL